MALWDDPGVDGSPNNMDHGSKRQASPSIAHMTYRYIQYCAA